MVDRMKLFFAVMAAAGLLGVSACSSDSTEDPVASDTHSSDAMDHTVCLGTEMSYMDGVQMTSAGGKFKVTIDMVDPAWTPAMAHTLHVTIVDAADAPIENAEFTDETNTWQHVHMHTGATAAGTGTYSGADGKYTISGMNIAHAGSWEIRIELKFGEETDRATFHFCIEGDGTDGTDGTDHSHHTDGTDATDGTEHAHDGTDATDGTEHGHDSTDGTDHGTDGTDGTDHADGTEHGHDGTDGTDHADGTDGTEHGHDGTDHTDGTDA